MTPTSQMLFTVAERRGLAPRWLTKYGIFVLELDHHKIPFYMTYSAGNSQMLSRLTLDKFATRKWLAEHALPNIPYCYTTQRTEINRFIDQHGSVIAKPVLGERGLGVKKISTHREAAELDAETTIFEKYIDGTEYRVLLLQGEVLGIQKKVLDPQPKYPWRKKRINLSAAEYPLRLVELDQKAYEAVPQGILAVDFIIDELETTWILELNSAPGLWSFAHPHEGEPQDFSDQIFDHIVRSFPK